MAPRHGESRKRPQSAETTHVSTPAGRHNAKSATSEPATPATRYPIRLVISTLGPGAACATAKSRMKSVALVQPFTSTM